MAKKYHNLGSMKVRRKKNESDPAEYYIEIDREMLSKISIEGKPISKFIQVERPTAKFDRMLAAGKMSEAEYDKRVADFDASIDPETGNPRGKSSFVKFDLQVVTED